MPADLPGDGARLQLPASWEVAAAKPESRRSRGAGSSGQVWKSSRRWLLLTSAFLCSPVSPVSRSACF